MKEASRHRAAERRGRELQRWLLASVIANKCPIAHIHSHISLASSPENRFSVRLFLTAIATAVWCPMSTTRFLPRAIYRASLTTRAQREFARAERMIPRGLKSFLEVVMAVKGSCDKRLCRRQYGTFEETW
jgi:hypothetical protein